MTNKRAFYAFSNYDKNIVSTIEGMTSEVNDSIDGINISKWSDFNVGGKSIISNILKQIDECDLFICDLSYLNSNVLYELGYAIAKDKKIWITMHKECTESKTLYKRLRTLSTIGYREYSSVSDLVNGFRAEMPHLMNISVLETYSSIGLLEREMLVLKDEDGGDHFSQMSNILQRNKIPYKVDDPYEGAQPLQWFLDIFPKSLGLIVHFKEFGTDEAPDLETAKKMLICGIALGMGKEMLLMVPNESSTSVPLDINELVTRYDKSNDFNTQLITWLKPIKDRVNERSAEFNEYKRNVRGNNNLARLNIGDYTAENEPGGLVEYFLETAEYQEALRTQQMIFIGRKGTGKTANLIKLRHELGKDRRNFVCSIQPQGTEFEGMVKVLRDIENNAEPGHLIESIWEYLIYTELANQYVEHLNNRPAHYTNNENENKLVNFVESKKKFIDVDFTLRLSNIINELKKMEGRDTIEEYRLKVSEMLHSQMLSSLRQYLGNALGDKNKVTILVDNLDKNWDERSDLEYLSKLIFGLLSVTQKVTEEFRKKDYKNLKVNMSLIVFLRSDIYSQIRLYASERDKLQNMPLAWSNFETLFLLIERRVDYSETTIVKPDEMWATFFCPIVKGESLKKYVENLILPRPRDIIFLFKAAITNAVNRGHSIVEEEDFIQAEHSYSSYAFDSLMPEKGRRVKDLDKILYNFAGSSSIIDEAELTEYISEFEESNDTIVSLLLDLTFLGQETKKDEFKFYHYNYAPEVTNKLAEKYADKNGKRRYMINRAFYSYLEIEELIKQH
ncbi:hypothetical protein HCA68_01885 [Listeria booriae]|uniref:P-loop ATPase, Sll1717 family n=1 Tax=Listeria booriae TaxID=1552123 RepID=UPI001628F7E6|nr:hypothetical protein [Listeria booriae]MBC1896410.1 hypothetical protein [Listeria booriae]